MLGYAVEFIVFFTFIFLYYLVPSSVRGAEEHSTVCSSIASFSSLRSPYIKQHHHTLRTDTRALASKALYGMSFLFVFLAYLFLLYSLQINNQTKKQKHKKRLKEREKCFKSQLFGFWHWQINTVTKAFVK